MVAISLYRGNLHKVPDAPRRWTTPKPTISHKDFKILLRRRSRALSRLRSSVPTVGASIPNPNPNPNPSPSPSPSPSPGPKNSDPHSTPVVTSDNNDSKIESLKEKEKERLKEEGEDPIKELAKTDDALVQVKNEKNVENVEKKDFPPELDVEAGTNTITAVSDKEKRKKEIKEKLEILNEKKHSLVQVLKQILNAEGQLKRQNITQGNSSRPPLPLQVETATTDSGSMTKVNTPRIGSEGNPCSQRNGGEADDDSNPNLQSCQLLRMNGTSPLSDTQQLKPPSNMVPHSYRTTMTVAGSPSRFTPTTGQGQEGPCSVSASGTTSYIASSPSPAASGGTSVFRDVKLPSPWN